MMKRLISMLILASLSGLRARILPATEGENASSSLSCGCLPTWAYRGGFLRGCAAPEGPNAPSWCLVNQSCPYPDGIISPSQLKWKFCRLASDSSPEPVKTEAGCTCRPTWSESGRVYGNSSCNAEGWCAIEGAAACEREPAGTPTAFAPGWDWCADAARPAPDDTETSDLAQLTVSGCRCSLNFTFHGEEYTGGSGVNPLGDPGGDFCFVDIRSCPRAPFALHSASGPWDYCTLPSFKTANGCRCRNSWYLFPNDEVFVGGSCGNPDSDSRGPWCAVYEHTCERPPAGHLAHSGLAFDYCSSAVGPAPEPSSAPDLTNAGCSCLPAWTFGPGSGQVLQGCLNPDNDAAGPWCVVDAKRCPKLPYGRTTSKQFYDYCLPAPNVTKAGCACARKWLFPPSDPEFALIGTCANLDGDANGLWCVVSPSSCSRGIPTGRLITPSPNRTETDFAPTPALGPVFDYCEEEAVAGPGPAEATAVPAA